MSMVNEIIERVGTKKLCRSLGVRATAVSNAKAAQKFPSRWFVVVQRLSLDAGIDVESDAFTASFSFVGRAA